MAFSVPLPHPSHCFVSKLQDLSHGCCWSPVRSSFSLTPKSPNSVAPIRAAPSTLPLSVTPPVDDSPASKLELADPDFYKMGFANGVRVFGIEFREGPDGFGVYASKDIEPLPRSRIIMEIPMALMLNISKKFPWMFFPNRVPDGHPIFDIINSTDPETDWDLRLACLILFSIDRKDDFWQSYGDFLPSAEEATSLLLATEEDLSELQDSNLSSTITGLQQRALEFWQKNWHSGVPLKIRRLAREPERFLWAVGMAQTRYMTKKLRMGALVQDTYMMVPYADMLNHSLQPNCFFHWRHKDRTLEVMVNAGQRVKKGEEMTINYLDGMNGLTNSMLMQRYGFSSSENPWDEINFSGNSRIHLDSFLSVFNIAGIPDEYYFNSRLSSAGTTFLDGAVIAAARTLPTWSDGDVPPVPSMERKAAKALQVECQNLLAEFPTTPTEDQEILDSLWNPRGTYKAAIKYRLYRKLIMEKTIEALGIYHERLLF